MANDDLIADIRGMIEDMLTLAKSRNPNVSTILTFITESDDGIYIDFSAMDSQENVIAKYYDFTSKEDSED